MAWLSSAPVRAADWLSYAADPQHSAWQKHEKILNSSNVRNLKLIWKRKLDNVSAGSRSLTPPVILGRLITHRGIKELIFIGGSSDKIFAVDADLGTLFWERQLDRVPPHCGDGMTAAPVITPRPPGTENFEEEDVPQTLRPVFALASDGRLYALRPLSGEDAFLPRRFIDPGARASALSLESGVVYTVSNGGCGGPSAQEKGGTFGLDTRSSDSAPFAASQHNVPRGPEPRASWIDSSGTEWNYTAFGRGVAASKVTATGSPHAWDSPEMPPPVSMAIANGVIYALTGGSPAKHSVLYALDAITGKLLYSSGDTIQSFVSSSALAVANGHVCFGTHDNTLYCFGFPIDR